MILRLIFIVILVIAGWQSGQAQILEKSHSPDYLKYGNKLIPVEKLYPILEGHIDPLIHYNNYMQNKKTAKIAGFAFLGMFVGGLTLIAVIQEPEDCRLRVCITDAEIVAGVAVLISPAIGLFSLGSAISASSNKNKMIKSFNAKYSYHYGQPEPANLGLGMTNNGIGLILNF